MIATFDVDLDQGQDPNNWGMFITPSPYSSVHFIDARNVQFSNSGWSGDAPQQWEIQTPAAVLPVEPGVLTGPLDGDFPYP